MLRALHQWTRQNGFPSIPKPEIMTLTSILWTQHCDALSTHITKSTIPALGKTIEVQSFTARTNRHHHYEYFVLACTTSPWNPHSSTERFLDLWQHNLMTWWPKCYPLWNETLEKAILGHLAQVVNSPPATSWQGRKSSTPQADQSFPWLNPLSDPCWISWLGWPFNWFLSGVQTTLLLKMSLHS